MALTLEHLDCRAFDGLEPVDPAWLEERDYWESYIAALYRSNGLPWSEADSNVDVWLRAPDRAPFIMMAERLLPALRAGRDLSRVALAIVAHWTPDLHLGTSVSNYLLHELGLETALGFAISERGLSAPLFAADCAERYLQPGQQALILIADQKHLLYRSPDFQPDAVRNSASLLLLERDGPGRPLAGYRRQLLTAGATVSDALGLLRAGWPAWPDAATLIADPALLAASGWRGPARPFDPAWLCSAPFAELGGVAGPAVLLQADGDAIYALAAGEAACG